MSRYSSLLLTGLDKRNYRSPNPGHISVLIPPREWMMQNTWGQIALFDLYSGFMLGLALIWLLEPSLPLRLGMTVLLPLTGNPILALWLLYRWQKLRRMAQTPDFD